MMQESRKLRGTLDGKRGGECGELSSRGPQEIPPGEATPRFGDAFSGCRRIAAPGHGVARGACETAIAIALLLGFGLVWAGVESLEGVEGPLRGGERNAVTTFAVATAWSNPVAALSWNHAKALPNAVSLRPLSLQRDRPGDGRR